MEVIVRGVHAARRPMHFRASLRETTISETLELARCLDRAAVAGSEQLRLAVRSPAPDGSDGVDDIAPAD